MSENLPSQTDSNLPAPNAPQATEQHPMVIEPGGNVTLPVKHEIAKGSDEFYEILAQNVPDELSSELQALVRHKHPRYSLVQVLMASITLVGLVSLAVWLFPKSTLVPPKYEDIKNIYVIVSGPWEKLTRETDVLLEQHRPAECINLVKQHSDALETALATPTKEALLPLRHLFINLANAFRQLPSLNRNSSELLGKFMRWLKKAETVEPDEVVWPFLQIELQAKQILPSHKWGYKSYLANTENSHSQAQIYLLLKQIDDIETRMKTFEDLGAEKSVVSLKSLHLIQCMLLLRLWPLEGGRDLPDDEGAPGVEAREKALKIALRYPEEMEFLNIRAFILDTLVNGDNLFNRIYYNGKTSYSAKELKNELAHIRELLNQQKGEGGKP